MLVRVRIAPVDLVGHALHRAHRVAADLDALSQRVIGQDRGQDGEHRQPGPPRSGVRSDGADDIEDRELGEHDLLRRAQDRERMSRGGQTDRSRDEEVVGYIERGRRSDHGHGVLPAINPPAGRNTGGQEDKAGCPGGEVELRGVEEDRK